MNDNDDDNGNQTFAQYQQAKRIQERVDAEKKQFTIEQVRNLLLIGLEPPQQ